MGRKRGEKPKKKERKKKVAPTPSPPRKEIAMRDFEELATAAAACVCRYLHDTNRDGAWTRPDGDDAVEGKKKKKKKKKRFFLH
jgi:hypothetical protein